MSIFEFTQCIVMHDFFLVFAYKPSAHILIIIQDNQKIVSLYFH